MNCFKCKKLITLMHDECINDKTLQAILCHINECESCSNYYEVIKSMQVDLSSLHEQPLPDGFHNKVHFALKRVHEEPKTKSAHLSKRVKIAALSACSIVLIVSAISILPNIRMNSDATTEMAYDVCEEITEDEMYEEPMMQLSDSENEESLTGAATEIPPIASAFDNTKTANERKGAPNSCISLSNGNSIVIVIDAEDISEATSAVSEYILNPIDTSAWVLPEAEPESYTDIRTLLEVYDAVALADSVVLDFVDFVDYYYVSYIEYDDIEDDLDTLQNMGYVYIVIK